MAEKRWISSFDSCAGEIVLLLENKVLMVGLKLVATTIGFQKPRERGTKDQAVGIVPRW